MLSGPHGSMILADLGCETIKVEPPIKVKVPKILKMIQIIHLMEQVHIFIL